jgi:hypothetical protein
VRRSIDGGMSTEDFKLTMDGLVAHWKFDEGDLGLLNVEADLYMLPEGEEKPVVGEWVHLAGSTMGIPGEWRCT